MGTMSRATSGVPTSAASSPLTGVVLAPVMILPVQAPVVVVVSSRREPRI
jgi:hypothetical protein